MFLSVFIFVDTDGLMRGFPDTLVSGKSGFTGVYKPMEAIVTHTSIDFMQLVLTGTEQLFTSNVYRASPNLLCAIYVATSLLIFQVFRPKHRT